MVKRVPVCPSCVNLENVHMGSDLMVVLPNAESSQVSGQCGHNWQCDVDSMFCYQNTSSNNINKSMKKQKKEELVIAAVGQPHSFVQAELLSQSSVTGW